MREVWKKRIWDGMYPQRTLIQTSPILNIFFIYKDMVNSCLSDSF